DQGSRGDAGLLARQDRGDDARRDRRRFGDDDAPLGLSRRQPAVRRRARRLDDLRHDPRRFRRPLARHRLSRRLDDAVSRRHGRARAVALVVRLGLGRDRRHPQGRGVLLGDDHPVADPRHRARRLDGRFDRARLRRRRDRLRRPAGARRLGLLRDRRLARRAVLDRLHPHPAARRHRRRFPRQAGRPWRPRVEPPARLGGHRRVHRRLPRRPAAARRAASGVDGIRGPAIGWADPPTEAPAMAADPNRIILTGENPFIRLGQTEGGPQTTNASFWRIVTCPKGPGHVLYLKSELTENRWRIYSDNIAMARWLQQTVQGMLNPETADTTIPVTDAEFSKTGDPRYFWTERVSTLDEEISLTWYDIGDPLLIHTSPGEGGRKYGVCTLLIPALGARLSRNGTDAAGTPFAT